MVGGGVDVVGGLTDKGVQNLMLDGVEHVVVVVRPG